MSLRFPKDLTSISLAEAIGASVAMFAGKLARAVPTSTPRGRSVRSRRRGEGATHEGDYHL